MGFIKKLKELTGLKPNNIEIKVVMENKK